MTTSSRATGNKSSAVSARIWSRRVLSVKTEAQALDGVELPFAAYADHAPEGNGRLIGVGGNRGCLTGAGEPCRHVRVASAEHGMDLVLGSGWVLETSADRSRRWLSIPGGCAARTPLPNWSVRLSAHLLRDLGERAHSFQVGVLAEPQGHEVVRVDGAHLVDP